MYLRNKMVFLKSHGWTVTVFFYNEGPVLIDELMPYNHNIIRELMFPVSAIGSRKVSNIINRIAGQIGNSGECIIETHVYHMSYWAELLAKRVNGRSLLFLLHESLPHFSNIELNFLRFKTLRGEFINSIRLNDVLGDDCRTSKLLWDMPSYSNVTSDIPYKIDYNKNYKTILSLGRLDKPYIKPMIEEIVSFTEKAGQKVNLFFVGGAADTSYIKKIEEYLKDKDSIIPYFFGYLYPVPTDIIKASNVAIASSGSVLVPTEQGVPTIAIDTQDYMAMGIYGKTTNNTFLRSTEPLQKTSELLYEVLVDDKYNDIAEALSPATLEANNILQKHLNLIESLNVPKEYYDVFSVYTLKERMSEKMKRAVKLLIGERRSQIISALINSH